MPEPGDREENCKYLNDATLSDGVTPAVKGASIEKIEFFGRFTLSRAERNGGAEDVDFTLKPQAPKPTLTPPEKLKIMKNVQSIRVMEASLRDTHTAATLLGFEVDCGNDSQVNWTLPRGHSLCWGLATGGSFAVVIPDPNDPDGWRKQYPVTTDPTNPDKVKGMTSRAASAVHLSNGKCRRPCICLRFEHEHVQVCTHRF
jgi:hypothetical protein